MKSEGMGMFPHMILMGRYAVKILKKWKLGSFILQRKLEDGQDFLDRLAGERMRTLQRE